MLLTDELSQTMTSLEVAKAFGQSHKDVLRSKKTKGDGRTYTPIILVDANGRDQPGVKLNLRAVIDFANSSRKENGVTRCY